MWICESPAGCSSQSVFEGNDCMYVIMGKLCSVLHVYFCRAAFYLVYIYIDRGQIKRKKAEALLFYRLFCCHGLGPLVLLGERVSSNRKIVLLNDNF